MKKNIIMITIILVVTIVVFSVGTYAYFAISFHDTRTEENKQNTTSLKTCELAEATTISNIPNSIGSFTSTNIFPGHKEVASLSVTASGKVGSSSSFQLMYDVTENELKDNVSVSVYKSNEMIQVSENYFECVKKIETVEGESKYYETCKEKELGELVQETILTGGKESIEIGKDILVIRNEKTGRTRYYYVVIEFLNKENQNEMMSSKLNGRIHVELTPEKTKYKESILNGMDPVLKDELIPVTIENDGTVRRADESDNWYSYEKQEWANAIILKEKSETYCPGEIIEEESIESYFVWIPKYRYQLWDLGNYSGLSEVDTSKVHTIPVIFGDYNTSDSIEGECTTPMTSGSTGNCELGDYMTHPAFLSIPSTGFWVGKFETGYDGATTTMEAEKNEINPSKIIVKPNVYSWRNIQVANAFYSTYDYKRNLDSHMMKNTEWGSVAYLQHSEYGSHTSVRINNNSNYITGYASVKEPTCGYTGDNRDCNQYGTSPDITLPYNTETGYLASTTGNITGIYDMSGGSWEYMMGVKSNINNQIVLGLSGFENIVPEKYFNHYKYKNNIYDCSNRLLGDATCEFGPTKKLSSIESFNSWYNDFTDNRNEQYPWILRGGHYYDGTGAGIFSFISWHGGGDDAFRLILTPSI